MKAQLRFLRHTKAKGLFHYLHIHSTRNVKVNSLSRRQLYLMEIRIHTINDVTGYADYMDKYVSFKVNHLKIF